MTINYQKGPVPSLLNVYKNILFEFITFLKSVDNKQFMSIVDKETEDKDCYSIQTIVSHIINSGFGYAHYIRLALNVESERPDYKLISIDEIETSLTNVYKFTEDTFAYKNITYNEVDLKIVKTPWNDDLYSIESILEHAIVDILRHKNQIARFIKILNTKMGNENENK